MSAKRLGILGGGQLGRMAAMAASRLGIEVAIYAPEPDSPAFQVCSKVFCGSYDDANLLRQFADWVDVITYEFENIPTATLDILQKTKNIFPDQGLLDVSQHRVKEKTFLNSIGCKTARFAPAQNAEDIYKTLQEWGVTNCIIKTCRFGYDGKGQAKIHSFDEIEKAFLTLNSNDIIIEEIIDFECEISCIIARDKLGQMALYEPSLNHHRHHILSETIVPSNLSPDILEKAKSYSSIIAEAIDLIGLCAIEFFVTRAGDVLVNEIAPRPHNSGHWTIDACSVSQFEQQVRAVCGLPLGDPSRHSNARMMNLIGRDVEKSKEHLETPFACIHLYGKSEVKDGRKMGHITFLSPLTQNRN
jgi:5-(carboxyamino)imidazole ribonucleotide synthase